ncbi:hypothetical protein BJF89_08700 [Corynebacterium sp. CNJ-954]|uniref:hypothetical protein n=1 Tax=Corynebacterium sp. CNJ-954 TaxID=1904962 RepID=UPI000961454D|nr:hypothetical protein [Corynebacterium sp. CNJ-954]OLT51179.1 hypothetical protein BJF89_08700 [Corynebacterium sp. CNJ-954]
MTEMNTPPPSQMPRARLPLAENGPDWNYEDDAYPDSWKDRDNGTGRSHLFPDAEFDTEYPLNWKN